MNKEVLYDWLFMYNPFIDKWCAARREDHNLLYSNIKSEKVLRSSRVSVLEELIIKTNGDPKKINKLVK
jgi:hypothetical protein